VRARGERHRRRWLILACCAAGLIAAGAVLYPVASGRTDPPVNARERARSAVETARGTGAARLAPGAMSRAEAALRSGLASEQRQGTRLFFRRDYRRVREQYLRAEALADSARAAGMGRADALKARALGGVDRAGDLVAAAESVASHVPLSKSWRTRLRRSKLALSEADAAVRAEKWEGAAERARFAAGEAQGVLEHARPSLARFTDEAQLREWRRLKQEAVSWSASTGKAAIVINKERRLLTLYVGGSPARSYPIELGRNGMEPKRRLGDKATPEGAYHVELKLDRGESKYHRALRIDYPNEADRRRLESARREGLADASARLGRFIEIHGEGGRGHDWTDGCVALTNRDMDDLFKRVGVGTPVVIVGGDGSGGVYSNLMRKFYESDFLQRP
jgi:hypothetical protein